MNPADLDRWRADTPGVRHRNHLNNAGASLPPRAVSDAVAGHLALESEIGGYEAADAAAAAVEASYAAVASLVGAAPRNIAIVENATVAFAQALSSIDFVPGDVIVTTRNDYISNQLAYLSLAARRGVEVRRAADLPGGGVDPDAVRTLLRAPRVRLLAATWVPTNSGLVQPAATLGQLAREAGVPYLLDACQAVGQMPVDVAALGCDFLSATARKFLRGPRGIGFLYVADGALARGAAPLHLDMRGGDWLGADEYALAADARRFENWEFAYALVLGLGAAARYALAVGIERGGARAATLAARLRASLATLPGARVLDRGPQLAAIVTVEFAGLAASALVARLRERGINCSASPAEVARIDMAEKGARAALRLSPHYYNTEAELEACLAALAELTDSRHR